MVTGLVIGIIIGGVLGITLAALMCAAGLAIERSDDVPVLEVGRSEQRQAREPETNGWSGNAS